MCGIDGSLEDMQPTRERALAWSGAHLLFVLGVDMRPLREKKSNHVWMPSPRRPEKRSVFNSILALQWNHGQTVYRRDQTHTCRFTALLFSERWSPTLRAQWAWPTYAASIHRTDGALTYKKNDVSNQVITSSVLGRYDLRRR